MSHDAIWVERDHHSCNGQMMQIVQSEIPRRQQGWDEEGQRIWRNLGRRMSVCNRGKAQGTEWPAGKVGVW